MGGRGTLSTRSLWPFMRATADQPADPAHLARLGLDVATLADPDGRISHDLARALLLEAIERTQDAALGLRAGAMVESTDMGVLHYAVRNCRDLRAGLRAASKYLQLADSLVEGRLVEQGERATWFIDFALAAPLPQTNDFQVSFAVRAIQHLTASTDPPLEVHMRHRVATNERLYAEVFRCPVILGAERNALVFPRAWLERPLAGANPALLPAFEEQAQRLLLALQHAETISARVQRLMLRELGHGQSAMGHIARQLHMSPSTLRRRLLEEGTTHTALLDETRRELALKQVTDSHLSIGELSLLLGFSNPAAFSRAFRRWTGSSPVEYRSRDRS